MNTIFTRVIFSTALLFVTIVSYGQAFQFESGRLSRHIHYLASPELEGRKSGTTGDSLAAIYIRDQFQQTGLQLLESNGFQYFSLVSDVRAGEKNALEFNRISYTAGTDFQPFSFSSSATVNAPVIFAGFGISGTSGDLHWDDFQGIDVKDKWVIALRGDPEPDNSTSAFIPMAADRAKALAVKDRGAAGLLLVTPSSIDRADQTVDISFDKSVSDAGLPVVSITRKLAALLLRQQVTAVDSLEKLMISVKKPASFDPGTFLNATTDVIREKAVSRNVVAMLKGSDPALAGEFVVIGAHYDHLGMGGFGSGSRLPDTVAVHAGADDNASGVASLIELARSFAARPERAGRSMLFVAFGAEEMGLLGARWFVANSPVPLSSVKAMLNMDMVGRLSTDDPRVTISGTGTFTVADSIIDATAAGRPFEIGKSPDGFGPSDHAAFYGEGIPVLFFSTGAHGDYHTPFDLPDRINYTGQATVTSFVESLASGISLLPSAPLFTESGSRQQAGHYGRNLKVTLGIMPDVSGAETSGGMKVEGVRNQGPAARAGMAKGDIIVAINGMTVNNVYDYMGRMGKLKPGETVNIEVIRNGKHKILIVQL
ncbi:MAG TPA: M28 family peptidase [Lentimicrobium sp.]|nr:M28 family peptidase [Lentimicrobium sp.]